LCKGFEQIEKWGEQKQKSLLFIYGNFALPKNQTNKKREEKLLKT
jgi:hypothetical protein